MPEMNNYSMEKHQRKKPGRERVQPNAPISVMLNALLSTQIKTSAVNADDSSPYKTPLEIFLTCACG